MVCLFSDDFLLEICKISRKIDICKQTFAKKCTGPFKSLLNHNKLDSIQLFTGEANILEVTQTATLSQEGRSAKKRRLESGWSAVRDILVSAGQAPYVIPWLQLVARLVQKYPQNFPQDQLYLYLDVLAKLLTEFKKFVL